MTIFKELANRGIKCEICGADTVSFYGGGWDNDRIFCANSDCGAEYVFPTSTESPEKNIYTPEMAGSGQYGICVKCGLGPTPEGHDGCLGTLKGDIMNACCGHGNDDQAYIQYWNRPQLDGAEAVKEQKRLIEEAK